MPTVKNKTTKPLSVPLPGGKRLFLGPGKSGEVTPKALEHAALQALVEAGELEISQGGRSAPGGDSGGGGISPTKGRSAGGSIRHFGDR